MRNSIESCNRSCYFHSILTLMASHRIPERPAASHLICYPSKMLRSTIRLNGAIDPGRLIAILSPFDWCDYICVIVGAALVFCFTVCSMKPSGSPWNCLLWQLHLVPGSLKDPHRTLTGLFHVSYGRS